MVGKEGGNVIYQWVPTESKGKFRYPDLTSTAAATVAVGITTATALQEARRLLTQQEPRSPQFHWSCCTAKAAKASSHLWRLLLFYTCSTIAAVSSLDGQIPRVLCCRGCWSTIAEIASVKAEGRKNFFNLLPVLPILAKPSGKCSVQVPPQKNACKG